MCEELRKLCRFNNVALYIAESVVTEALHYLRHIEKGDVDRVTLESPHGILKQERVVSVLRQEERHSSDGVDRGPVQKILPIVRRGVAIGEE